MNFTKKDLLLYAITDRSWAGEGEFLKQVELALKGGVTCLQLREKNLEREAVRKEAYEVKELCRKYGIPLIINDDVSLAKEIDADGVHLGQKDLEPGKAREILGEGKIIGVSAKTMEQALAAWKQGADYLGIGAVFPTGTKLDAREVEHETVKQICQEGKLPAVAIGGITKDNIASLAGNGLAGVAVISAIFAQENILEATMELKRLAERMVEG